jgi:membrane protein
MNIKAIFELFKATAQDWSEDKASRLGAALAYYSVFSMAPLLLVAIAVAGIFLGGQESARQQVVQSLGGVIGADAARQVGQMIQGADKQGSGLVASIIGIGTLLLGASGVFGALQDSLNTIWEVQPKPGQGIWATVKARFLSLTMVFGTGFLLLVSLLWTSVLKAVVNSMSGVRPISGTLLQGVTFIVTFFVVTLLFTMIYKVLPDVKIQWRDVWIGAAITALLFLIGQAALSWYLGTQSTQSVYGAAGSLVVLLLYVYYSAQIVFFGAEFTQVYANKYGSHIEPAANAMAMTEEMRAQQGMTRSGGKGAPATGAVVTHRPDGSPITAPRGAAARPARPAQGDSVSDVANVLAGLGLVMLFKKWRRGKKRA